MTGNILTPAKIWADFKIDETPKIEVISESVVDDILVTHVYIDGEKTENGQVKIYGILARNVKLKITPAIVVLPSIDEDTQEELVISIAKQGFFGMSIDIFGDCKDRKLFTVYPEDKAYANYSNAYTSLYNYSGSVKDSFYYEWGKVLRYSLAYLKSLPYILSIGGLGIKDAGTVMWHVAGTTDIFSALTFVLNSGWLNYKGKYRFDEQIETQFSDDTVNFIAGIEPQSYASKVSCPCLILSATNNPTFDCDRASDTLARINSKIYTAVDYSVTFSDGISNRAYKNAMLFFKQFLFSSKKDTNVIPSDVDIKCSISGKKLDVEVLLDTQNLNEIALFYCEETLVPSLRSWNKCTDYYEKLNNKFSFSLSPYNKSGIIVLFARALYKNGYSVCSNIISKRFTENEVLLSNKSNIVFSSRIENAKAVFAVADLKTKKPCSVDLSGDYTVLLKRGPMDIDGLYSKTGGLITYKINSEKDKPKDDSMLIFDVYSKDKTQIDVALTADCFGKKVEYVAKVNVAGGELWHNVRLEMSKFKTIEGKILKSYESINSLSFNSDGEYILNNVLWV